MATVIKPTTSNRLVLEGVSFGTYHSLRRDLDHSGRRVRLAFDRGTLEIMSPLSYEHESASKLLALLIEAIAFVLNVPIAGAKSTTFAREDLDRGIEPDECFYIANEPRIRFHKEIDIAIDPPPDLAIEVDISRSSLNKVATYAALGVPELWRLDDGRVQILSLGPDRRYESVDASVSFPFLTKGRIELWIDERATTDQTTWIRAVHAWVCDEIAPGLGDQVGR